METTQQLSDHKIYKERMYQVIADLFEKIGAGNPNYSDTQKATDILEVLSTLLAYTIYNSCPDKEAIRDASESVYFQIKQMALAYHYQQQEDKKNGGASGPAAPGGKLAANRAPIKSN